MRMKLYYVGGLLLLLFASSGCSGRSNTDTGKNDISTEPVTLRFNLFYGGLSDADFDAYFVEQVKKKYPHITVVRDKTKLADSIAANQAPDIIQSGLPGIPSLLEFAITENLDPYMKKFGINTSIYDPVIVESIKRFSDKNEMIALPFRNNIPVLFYNKNIFDKFGVAYPKNGMTWKEAADLAVALTRNDAGVQYLGLFTGDADRLGMGFSTGKDINLPYVNKQTNKADLETDGWKSVLTLFHSIHSVPGYVQNGKLFPTSGATMFYTEQNIAMAAYWGADMLGFIKDKLGANGQPANLNFDMVTLPTFEKGKGYAWQVETNNLFINSKSKYKDQAFQVVSYIASEEMQKLFNKRGQLPVLKATEEIKKDFGKEVSLLQGKYTDAFFVLQSAQHDHTKYDQEGRKQIRDASTDIVTKGVDVNTALRNAQDKLNKYIQEENAR